MNKHFMFPVMDMLWGIPGRTHFKQAHAEIFGIVFFSDHDAACNIFYFFIVHDDGQDIFIIGYFHFRFSFFFGNHSSLS